MQTFNAFDNTQNKKLIESPTWEEYNSLLEQVNSLTATIASLQETITSLQSSITDVSSSVSTINTTLKDKLQFHIKSISLSRLLGWKESDGRIKASTMMTNLVGTSTGDCLVCIGNNSTSTGRTIFYESQSNYRSMILVGNLKNYGNNANFWLDGSKGGEFDVTWSNQTPTADTYATTFMFFSRH